MAQQTFALLTTKGRAKEAGALASGKSINISHIAIGSGETVPSGGETKLYREVLRKAISGNGLVAGSENTAYFDIFLSASEGPFTIREAGLLDDEGDLIAIACYDPPINKPIPTSGQTVEGIIRIEVAFSNIANITIKVDPSLNVPLQRLTTTPWVPVKAIELATPPTNPNIGDSYIIGSNSTGVWAAQEGNLTEFTQAGWAIIATPDGHGIGLPDGRVFTKVDGIYIEKIALDSQSGKWNYVEAQGTANALTATLNLQPAALVAGLSIWLKINEKNTGATTLLLNRLGMRPIIYHETGEPLIGGDFQAGDIVKLVYDGTSWRLQPSLAYMDKRYSRLTAPTTNTFYVDGQTGNDTNTGFSLAQAFKTIQGAINAISSRYITTGQIRIFVATGSTYSGFTFNQSFVSNWAISLPPGISGAIEVDARSGRGQGCLIPANVNVSLSNFHFQSYFENVNSRGNLTIKDCSFEAPTSTTVPIIGIWGGQAALQGTFYANGKATAFLISSTGATVQIGYQDEILSQPVGINYANGTSFSYANIVAVNGGSIVCTPSVLSFNGGPSGYRFICDLNGVINVKGAGNYIWPGTLEGKIIRGGQYF